MRVLPLLLLGTLLLAGPGAGLLQGVGVTFGPNGVLVLEPGWDVRIVGHNLSYPTALAFRGSHLLVMEAGRFPYGDPYSGQVLGRIQELALDGQGNVQGQRVVATGLADPLGMTVGPDGTVWIAQYRTVSRLGPEDYALGTVRTHSTGYPDTENDAFFLPVTGTDTARLLGIGGIDPTDGTTTGSMGLAVRASDGQLFVAQAAKGVPPDDDGVRSVTGLDYDNPYSSSVIAPRGGPLTPDQVAARACRNCYDLAFAPDTSPYAGQLFITENVGPYRLRAFAGSNRSIVAGSTPTDQSMLDGLDAVDLASGHIRRVANFRPDGVVLGITPTGLAFAPHGFPGHADALVVVQFSGTPPSNNRGELDIVTPDFLTGEGVTLPLAHGLDYPIDIAFAPDGRSFYVVEFYSGDLYRFSAP